MEKIIQITKEKSEQSKAQKEFNRLIKKIETLEHEMSEYRVGIEEIHQRIQGGLSQVRQEYYVQKAALVKCFDRAHDSDYFKKQEQKKLTYLICELAYDAIEFGGRQELIPIYDKHSETSYEEQSNQDNVTNLDDVQELMAKKLAEKQEEYDQVRHQEEGQKASRPKSKNQEKKEEKARSVTKSVRTIYVDLVKAFHPDREPNEEERERKTQIMHSVTEAYEKNDLLGLLRLQMEFDRIDQNHLGNIAESHLKNYNKLLREQVEALSHEFENRISQMAHVSGKPISKVANIQQFRMSLEQDIKEFKRVAAGIKKDIKAFESQLVLKEFLKNYEIH